MKFNNATFPSGGVWKDRWVSEDGMYSIMRYRHWNQWGRTCGPSDRCEAYFRAYTNHGRGGACLHDRNAKIATFAEAVALCKAHERQQWLRDNGDAI